MPEIISSLLPYIVLASHALFVMLVLATLFRYSWGKEIQTFLGRNAVLPGLIIASSAVACSLFYSEIMGYEPCILCWWQRVFIYPLVITFGMSLWKKTNSAFLYATPLALLSGVVAAYHSYISLGGTSILPCTAVGGACAKVYVMVFGYITLPVMALTIVAYILLLAWADKIYRNENGNA